MNAIATFYSILSKSTDDCDGSFDQLLGLADWHAALHSGAHQDIVELLSSFSSHSHATQLAGFIIWSNYWNLKRRRMPGWLCRGPGRFTSFVACQVIAAKAFSDSSMSNPSYALLAGVDVGQLNKIELDVLDTLSFNLVTQDDYKYWTEKLMEYEERHVHFVKSVRSAAAMSSPEIPCLES